MTVLNLTGKIALEVVREDADHFVLTFDRPGRVEVSLLGGRVVAHVYEGAEVDQEQDVLFAYDGTFPGNTSQSR